MIDFERLKDEVINKKTMNDFSPLAYAFCHFIENYSREQTYRMFFKNATLEDVVNIEKEFLLDYENVFYREIFLREYGDIIQYTTKEIQQKICKLMIKTFYEELGLIKSPMVKKFCERLEL